VAFAETLTQLGFRLVQQKRDADYFARTASPYLTYYIHAYPDGTALFTWEFAIAEYMATRGLQVGSDEHLNTFLYPQSDARGPQDAAWVAEQLERTEAVLDSISLLDSGFEREGGS
jgi:hypothetical protein